MRHARLVTILLAISMLAAGCGVSEDSPSERDSSGSSGSPSATVKVGGADDRSIGTSASPAAGDDGAAMQVFLVASELVVGQNRFAVGLATPDNAIIDDAGVMFEYFDLSNPAAPVSESKATAALLASADGLTVIYAHERTFDRAGNWGVQVTATRASGTTLRRNISFSVLADSPALAVGEQAPAIDSPTAADVNGDLSRLTSATQPNPAFYERSIADALANDKPTVVLFATPAFCETRFCGPDYDVFSSLRQRYGDTLNMIHVEVYSALPDPSANGWQLNQAMLDFGLQTEPWLYVIDAGGTVTWRVEGFFTEAEVVDALADIGVSG